MRVTWSGARGAWIVVLGCLIVACGNGGGAPASDAASGTDAAEIDAAEIDAAICAPTVAPTAPRGPSAGCNPATNSGCGAGEKCAWIATQPTFPYGHLGCVPDGPVAVGCSCSTGAMGDTGYDDCAAGSICYAGECTGVCQSFGESCAGGHCFGVQELYATSGGMLAGLCLAPCDPLTQTEPGGPGACGSLDPAAPDRGCYGYDGFGCLVSEPEVLDLTDRMPPISNQFNSCAPGFIPFFFEMVGSTVALCSGLCAALEIDNTPAHAGNGKGDATALAKLPRSAAPVAGDGTCDIGKKGSHASSTCVFLWPFVNDGTDGSFEMGPLLDTLGVCMAIEFFPYDPTGGMNYTVPRPDCATLPPRSAATPGDFDDAADWMCQKRSNSMPLTPSRAARDVRIGGTKGGAVPQVRHTFQ